MKMETIEIWFFALWSLMESVDLFLYICILNVNLSFSLTISVTAESGGYRELRNTNDNSNYGRQHFLEQSIQKTMQLQFDFYPPYHCIENKTCPDDALEIVKDITKVK